MSMSSNDRIGSTIWFFFHLKNYWSSIGTWGERTRFYFSRYSVMTCHKLSHFNSRVFTLYFSRNCCRLLEAKKFSRNPGQFNWVTSETRYHVSIAELLKRNHISPFAELFWRPRAILNILCFSGDNQSLQTAPWIMVLYDRVEKFSIHWSGSHNLRPRRQFQQNCRPGKPLGHISPEHLDRLFLFFGA